MRSIIHMGLEITKSYQKSSDGEPRAGVSKECRGVRLGTHRVVSVGVA